MHLQKPFQVVLGVRGTQGYSSVMVGRRRGSIRSAFDKTDSDSSPPRRRVLRAGGELRAGHAVQYGRLSRAPTAAESRACFALIFFGRFIHVF